MINSYTFQVYVWGAPSNGATGFKEQLEGPTLLEGLENYYVFSIAFAGWHSALLAVRLDD